MAEVVEESFETEVRRKVVRSAYKIEEVSMMTLIGIPSDIVSLIWNFGSIKFTNTYYRIKALY